MLELKIIPGVASLSGRANLRSGGIVFPSGIEIKRREDPLVLILLQTHTHTHTPALRNRRNGCDVRKGQTGPRRPKLSPHADARPNPRCERPFPEEILRTGMEPIQTCLNRYSPIRPQEALV